MEKKVYVVLAEWVRSCEHAFEVCGVYTTREAAEQRVAEERIDILDWYDNEEFEKESDEPGLFECYVPEDVERDVVWIDEQELHE